MFNNRFHKKTKGRQDHRLFYSLPLKENLFEWKNLRYVTMMKTYFVNL